MKPRRRIVVTLVVALGVAAVAAGVAPARADAPASVKPPAPATATRTRPAAGAQGAATPDGADARPGAADAMVAGATLLPAPAQALAPTPPTGKAAAPIATSPTPSTDWAVQATQAYAAKSRPSGQTPSPRDSVDTAAQPGPAQAASPKPADAAAQSYSGGATAGTNNLAPLPGGAGLVINDGRIPVGFIIDPKEYTGGVLRITNASGTPAILTINDPAAAAACSIAGEAVVVGKPYQVDGLEITAAHPVAVFVQPGRAPGPPAAPSPPKSDG